MDAESPKHGHDASSQIKIPDQIVVESADRFCPMRADDSVSWRPELQRIRERFVESAKDLAGLKCILVHSTVPEWPQRPEGPYPTELEGMEPVAMGAGPSRWPQQYFLRKQGTQETVVSELDPTSDQSYHLRMLGLSSKLKFGEIEFVPIVGDEVIQNSTGDPILFSDGQPIAIRPGVNRNYFVHAGGEPHEQITSVTSFFSIASEAGQALLNCPASMNRVLWRQWPDGFRTIGDKGMWVSALFELAWQQQSDAPLVAQRYSWSGKTNILLEAMGQPGTQDDPGQPAHWYSVIGDLAAASVAALDLLIAIDADS